MLAFVANGTGFDLDEIGNGEGDDRSTYLFEFSLHLGFLLLKLFHLTQFLAHAVEFVRSARDLLVELPFLASEIRDLERMDETQRTEKLIGQYEFVFGFAVFLFDSFHFLLQTIELGSSRQGSFSRANVILPLHLCPQLSSSERSPRRWCPFQSDAFDRACLRSHGPTNQRYP